MATKTKEAVLKCAAVEPSKYLVLKIAAGVFLGILAAVAVYKAIDEWESYVRMHRYIEQQKQEAEALERRISLAAKKLDLLSAKIVVGLCGSPLHPPHGRYYSNKDGALQHLDYEYIGADGREVAVSFTCYDYPPGDAKWGQGYCESAGMKRTKGTDPDHPLDYETMWIRNSAASQISEVKELPCLIGLADVQKEGGKN